MATFSKWVANSATDIFSTELDGLPDNSGALSSAHGSSGVFNNVSAGTTGWDGYRFGKIELVLKAGAGLWADGGALGLWWLATRDGANFEYATAGKRPFRDPDALFYPRPDISGDQYLFAQTGPVGARQNRQIELPFGQVKVYIAAYKLGQALAATNNTVKIITGTPSEV